MSGTRRGGHGATETEALDMLEEALILFFEGRLEHGVLWHELDSRGLAPTPNSQFSMEPAEEHPDWLSIPIALAPNPVEPKAALR
jgi:predicted RNase H-like HicB family nuclease